MDLDDFDLAGILTKAAGAIVILVATWLIAKVVRSVLSKQLNKVSVMQRHDASGNSLGESLATIASLVIWLFGLVAVLNLFELTEVVAPIQNLLDGVLGALPGILGAALLLFIGLVLSRVVRQLVETTLQAVGADRWTSRLSGDYATSGTATAPGAASATGGAADPDGPRISQIAGQLVQALLMITVAISALQVLGIQAISQPASQMLNLILSAIPSIIAAALLLAIGYVIARLVTPLLESTLRGLGADRFFADLVSRDATTSSTTLSSSSASPSAVIARIGQVAIMLFFAVAATRLLGFPEITNILNTVLEIGGSVLLGGAVIAAGVLVGNLIPRFVSGRVGQIARYATIGLFVAIGLGAMGLADSIVNLAFGAVVIGAAAAAALAFGLGGRDAAARELSRLQDRRDATTAPGTGSTPAP